MSSPLGLYVHVPFCARRCPYCDFAVHIGDHLVPNYVAAVSCELENVLATANRPITSVFFGGGTPTALSGEQLSGLMRLIRPHLAPEAEVSIEANPENLNAEKLRVLRETGWNRLSLGAQSFDDAALKTLGRAHDGARVEAVFRDARRAGWENISLDLIYAVPGQTRASWRDTLRRAADLEPEHVSCYTLTIEAETPFARRVERGQLVPVGDDVQAEKMQDAVELLQTSGLERYEVSNWSRAGRECRHNLNYWRGGDYGACGVGAHGHDNGHRWWNERSTPLYIERMRQSGSARAGDERLSPRERFDERLMLGLRLREGVELSVVAHEAEYRPDAKTQMALRREIERLRACNLVRAGNDDAVRLTPHAFAVADSVMARLLV